MFDARANCFGQGTFLFHVHHGWDEETGQRHKNAQNASKQEPGLDPEPIEDE